MSWCIEKISFCGIELCVCKEDMMWWNLMVKLCFGVCFVGFVFGVFLIMFMWFCSLCFFGFVG